VVFRQGVFEKMENSKNSIRSQNDKEWYVNRTKRTMLSVHNGVVRSVMYLCDSEHTDFTGLNSIQCSDPGDKIIRVFGDKVRVLCPKENDKDSALRRVYVLVEYGTRYRAERGLITFDR
jgi:hypothetical protein